MTNMSIFLSQDFIDILIKMAMNNKMDIAAFGSHKTHLYKGKVRPISDDYIHNMSNGEQYICINYTMN